MSTNVLRALTFVALIVVSVGGLVVIQGKARSLTDAQIGICERAKLDRIDGARAWTQAEETWLARGKDRRLSHSERALAIETAVVYGESANQLRTRLLECGPLIRDGRKIIDRPALLEAQGNL